MPTESPLASPAIPASHLLRLRDVLEELGASIARLAVALKLGLDADAARLRLLSGASQSAAATPREARLHEELRGLLVLRYALIARYARDLSPGGAAALLLDAERTLQARGFAEGADGCTVQRLLRT